MLSSVTFICFPCRRGLHWTTLLASCSSNWDKEKEIAAVRIASYLEHNDIVGIFLKRKASEEFFSTKADCCKAGAFGAAEIGSLTELVLYWENVRIWD